MLTVVPERGGLLQGTAQTIDTISGTVPFQYSTTMDTTPRLRSLVSRLQESPNPQIMIELEQNIYNKKSQEFEAQKGEQRKQSYSTARGEELKSDGVNEKFNTLSHPLAGYLQRDDSTTQVATVLHRGASQSMSRVDELENRSFHPPHIQVKLFRPRSLSSVDSKSVSMMKAQDNLPETDAEDKMARRYSTTSLSNLGGNKFTKKMNKFRNNRSQSLSYIGEITEDFDIDQSASDSSSSAESLGARVTPSARPSGLKKLFGKKRKQKVNQQNKITSPRPRPENPDAIASMTDLGPEVERRSEAVITDSENITSRHNGDSIFVDVEQSTSETDNNKILRLRSSAESTTLEHCRSRRRGSSGSNSNSIENAVGTSDEGDENMKVVQLRRGSGANPSVSPSKRFTLLQKFTTTLPPDEVGAQPAVVKDATDVHPLSNGETVVTDMLSSQLVVFDERGYPRVTFTLERGSEPWACCVGPDGTLAVTMSGKRCVNLWTPSGESVSEFGLGVMTAPRGIAYHPQGKFLVTDGHSNAIYLYDIEGGHLGGFGDSQPTPPTTPTTTTTPEATPPTTEMYSFKEPRYVSLSEDGLFFISDSGNHKIKIFNQDGVLLQEMGSYGRQDGQFRFPYGVAYDNEEKLVYVADHFNHRISVFGLDGHFRYHLLTEEDGLTRPKGLALRGSCLYVTYGNLRASNISVYHIHHNHNHNAGAGMT